jgi:hypothetical protein
VGRAQTEREEENRILFLVNKKIEMDYSEN